MLGCAWVCKVLGRAQVARVCMSCSGCTWGCTGCWGCARAARGAPPRARAAQGAHSPLCTGCWAPPRASPAAGTRSPTRAADLRGGLQAGLRTHGCHPRPHPRPRVPVSPGLPAPLPAPARGDLGGQRAPGAVARPRPRLPAPGALARRSAPPCTPPRCHLAPTPVTFPCVPPHPGSPRPVQAQRGAPGPEQPERAGARGRHLRHRGFRVGAGTATPRPGWWWWAPRRAHPQGDRDGDGHRDPPPC